MDLLKNGIMTHIKLYIENRTKYLRKLVSDVKSSTIEKLLSLYTETKILLKRIGLFIALILKESGREFQILKETEFTKNPFHTTFTRLKKKYLALETL